MPTVTVGRDRLFAALGKSYTDEQFDELCFEFGIELDDVTTEKEMQRKELHLDKPQAGAKAEDEEVLYKIEVPANRYDLLCLEGLARALRIFAGVEPTPTFRAVEPAGGPAARQRLVVKPETMLVRPFVVAAVLRGVTFDPTRYASFIDLQDKLHQNLCRQRTLVAIGTHDLATLQGPFSYEALPPEDIRFVPLKQTREFSARELFNFYKTDEAGRQLRKFLPIIEGAPVYPVIYDARRTVLSLPPIINGAHSAITLNTRDIFIECTATDLTKAKVVLNTVVTLFSGYCAVPFTIEPVDVVDALGKTVTYPDLSCRQMEVGVDYINGCTGLQLDAKNMAELLSRMQLPAVAGVATGGAPTAGGPAGEAAAAHAVAAAGGAAPGGAVVRVTVPPTRSDVLHACDVMEDVAIAHGFNRIPTRVPPTVTVGRPLPLNALSDLLRAEVAMAGFTEVLTWILISHHDNFEAMCRSDDGTTAAIVGNPSSSEFEMARTDLLPGLLKTLSANKDAPLPVRLFEISDVVLLDTGRDVGAKNARRLAALYAGPLAAFEVMHGLLDRVMEMLGVPFAEGGASDPKAAAGYYLVASDADGAFFPGRQARVMVGGVAVGTLGVIHPEVLGRFDPAIVHPCSGLEIDLEFALARI